MKIQDPITGAAASAAGRAGRARGPDPAASAVAGTASVTLAVSSRGREIQRARLAALNAPEVREGLVNELRARVESRTYAVSGSEVASKLVAEHLSRGGR